MSAGGHVPPLRHFFLIPSQPAFALTPKCGILNVEAAIINFIVFGLTQQSCPTIYRTWGKHANQYTTNVVLYCWGIYFM